MGKKPLYPHVPKSKHAGEPRQPAIGQYFTDSELTKLKTLQQELKNAKPHSKEAVAIGKQIREIHQQAAMRQTGPMPEWMEQFAKAYGIEIKQPPVSR